MEQESTVAGSECIHSQFTVMMYFNRYLSKNECETNTLRNAYTIIKISLHNPNESQLPDTIQKNGSKG